MTKHPFVKVADYAEYGEGRCGWIIETLHGFDAAGAPIYALPAWDEKGWDELSGPFPTKAAAEAALSDAQF